MKHEFLDKYSNLNSLIHKIDPRVKLITFGVTVGFIIFTRPDLFLAFLLYGLLITILIFLSRVPLLFILKRALVIIPFVLLIAIFIPFFKEGQIAGGYSFGTLKLTVSYNGLLIFWNVLIKSFLSILCMILLSNTTKFTDLLKALDTLRLPKLIIMVLSFMYRYVYVSIDELMRMNRAKDARTISSGLWFRFKTLSNMIATLFIRAYERGERVYLVMCSRGFDGEVKTLNNFRLRSPDFSFFAAVITALALIKFWT